MARGLGAVQLAPLPAPLAVERGDRFVLCSDGLCDLVEEDAIRDSALALDPFDACRTLIGLALKAGGPDNITVGVIVAAGPEGEAPALRSTRDGRPVRGEP